jgi:hypothetical protein
VLLARQAFADIFGIPVTSQDVATKIHIDDNARDLYPWLSLVIDLHVPTRQVTPCSSKKKGHHGYSGSKNDGNRSRVPLEFSCSNHCAIIRGTTV